MNTKTLLLLLLLIAPGCGFSGKFISEAKRARITPGMTVHQVKTILGTPNMDMRDPITGGRRWTYASASGFVLPFYSNMEMKTFEVHFDRAGKVVAPRSMMDLIQEGR